MHRVPRFLLLVVGMAAAANNFHVVEQFGRYVLVDRAGRERLVRGINLATLGGRNHREVPIDPVQYTKGACPRNDPAWYQPPLCEVDIIEAKERGFDAVRLLVHWSQIEPTPGMYQEKYLQRINQVIDWAEDSGVDVLVDFHQDNYANISTFCCAEMGPRLGHGSSTRLN